ncbi:MAG: DsbA family protein [Pseudomonadota bacterium]
MKNLKKLAIASLAGTVALMPFSSVFADSHGGKDFDPGQVQSIEEIIHDYLMENPEVLVEALQRYQDNQRVAQAEQQQAAIAAFQAELDGGIGAPLIGNPQGDVTLIEFFDYRCPYCKVVAPRVQEAVDQDPNLKVYMIEFPILSPQSRDGARAALAADKQGKYEDFHFALMDRPGNMSQDHIMAIAQEVGLDTDQLAEDMESEEIAQAIDYNHQVAQRLGIGGTPALIVGDQLAPGAIELGELQRMIEAARSGAS